MAFIDPATGQVLGGTRDRPRALSSTFGATAAPQAPMTQPQMTAPLTGLIGSEQALQGGLGAATSSLLTGALTGRGDIQRQLTAGLSDLQRATQAASRVTSPSVAAARINQQAGSGAFERGVGGLEQFVDPGVQAQQRQAALSGALGAEAQAQAFADFQESPGQKFLRDRAEQSLLRSSAAIGGLGGGNVRSALQEQAIGLAAQDLDRQFGRLGQVTGQGLAAQQAASGLLGQQGATQAQLASQQAQLQQQAANQSAALRAQAQQAAQNRAAQLASQAFSGRLSAGGQLADIATGTGRNVAQLQSGIAQTVASGRQRAGELLANRIGGTTSALADLAQQQGRGLGDIVGGGTSNLANLLAGSGATEAQNNQALAQLLANISTGSASNLAGVQRPRFAPIQPGPSTADLISAGGTLINQVAGLAGQGGGQAGAAADVDNLIANSGLF